MTILGRAWIWAFCCSFAPATATAEDPPNAAPTQVTLTEAIQRALASNAEFVILEQNVQQAEAQIPIARGALVPRLVGDLSISYDDFPGTVTQLESERFLATGNLGVRGRLLTGTEYRLEWLATYQRLDGFFTVYDPFQTMTLQVAVTQPLLRGAWFDVNRAPIFVASLRRDASRRLREARTMRLIADVEMAYWRLALALREREVQEGALELAKQQVKGSRTQLRHGAVAKIDVIEAEAEVSRTLEQIEASKQSIAEAEGRLAFLLQPPVRSSETKSLETFVPVDLPGVSPPDGTLAELLRTAEERRPDLAAARAELQASEVLAEVAENALLPKLDVVARAGVTGASGRLSRGYGTAGFNTPVMSTFTGEMLPPIVPDESLEGGFDTMLRNMRYPSASVGVLLEVPLDLMEREARHRVQKAEVVKQRARVEALFSRVSYEVLVAHRQLQADIARIETTRESVRLAETLLEGQRTRFKNGVAISFDVLRANAAVTRARIAHIRAQVNGRISLARLLVATGTYLEARGVTVVDGTRTVETEKGGTVK